MTVNLRKVIKTRENRLSQNQTDVVSNATEWATLHQSANQNKTLTLLSPKEETSPEEAEFPTHISFVTTIYIETSIHLNLIHY